MNGAGRLERATSSGRVPMSRAMGALVIFTCLLLGGLYVVTVNGDDYDSARHFIRNDARLASAIGKVADVTFEFWRGFNSVGGEGGRANYSFQARTTRGMVGLRVTLRCWNGTWRVTTVEASPDGGATERLAYPGA